MVVPRLFLAVLCLLIGASSGCARRACEDGQPSMQVTLEAGISLSEIQTLRAEITAAGISKTADLDPLPLKESGRASFVVIVGEAGSAGFQGRVSVRALDGAGKEIASDSATYSATGDACNELTLRLGGASDGGPPDGPPSDGPPDTLKGDGPVDGACQPACSGKICGDPDGCGGSCAEGSGCTPETYQWVTTSWGGCSATCDGGTQTRTVSCKNSGGGTVADSLCGGTKPASSQACNTLPCCSTGALQQYASCSGSEVYQLTKWGSNSGSVADRASCANQCTSWAKGDGETPWCCLLYEDSGSDTNWVCRVYYNYSIGSGDDDNFAALGECL